MILTRSRPGRELSRTAPKRLMAARGPVSRGPRCQSMRGRKGAQKHGGFLSGADGLYWSRFKSCVSILDTPELPLLTVRSYSCDGHL